MPAPAKNFKDQLRMNFMGKQKQIKHPPPSLNKCRQTTKHPPRCAALCCCSSRLSVSSSSDSTAGGGIRSSDSEQLESLSNLAHGMVQARLEHMVGLWQHHDHHHHGSSGGVFLVAMDRRSYDPKGDFRRSILEVITSERMEQPKELRSLLNCYLSMNSSEHRQVILEAFHEVCSALFF